MRQREKNRRHAEVYRRTHPDRVRQSNARYAAAHRAAWALRSAQRRARRLGNGGAFTLEEFRAKCELLGGVCVYCGEARPLTLDHKVPLSRGGRNDIANIVPACRSCNARKRDLTASEYLHLTGAVRVGVGSG